MQNSKRMRRSIAMAIQCYIMLTPSLVGMVLFVVYPILWIVRFCMYRFTGFGDPIFIGLGNLSRALSDIKFWSSVNNSFIFAFGKLTVELPLALVLANFLAEKSRSSLLYRTVFYLPSVLSVAIVGIQFSYLFGAINGVINEWMIALGISSFFGKKVPISWFSTRALSMGVLMLASIWQNFGVNMLFFMTGLQSIPQDLYEGAAIDGASKTQQFFYITIPMLGPVTQMVIMNAILGSLKITDLVLVLSNGQPAGRSEVMMTYIYKLFFGGSTASNYGYASTLVLFCAFILGIVAFIYLRTTRKISNIY
jgi:raffinose/stachyose/melibiose transport system permease protein